MNRDPADRISIAEARQALDRSGYLLESRLEKLLREREFRVATNGSFPDPETGKGRELDIWASYARCWSTGPDDTDNISFELVIECVNPPQPVAFITRTWPDGLLQSGDRWEALKVGGDPLHVPVEELATNWTWLASVLKMERYHHYAAGRLATQYCSFERKKGNLEWMAKHRDEDHATFRKLCDATSHYQRQLFDLAQAGSVNRNLCLIFLYPVLVVQGDLYEVRADAKQVEVAPADHLQYRCSQLYGARSEDFQVDVVTEDYFPSFLELLGSETYKTVTRMKRRHAEVREWLGRRAANERKYNASSKLRGNGVRVV